MRINLIGNFRTKGLMQDSMILRGMLAHIYGDKVEIRKVQHAMPDCADAELNIFIEVMNTCLLSRAAKNVWIPNPEWVFKTWTPYLSMVDEIWVKTREAEELFGLGNVKYIGWTSLDKARAEKKNYSKAIMLVGKNMYRNPKQTLKAYLHIMQTDSELYKSLPELYIPYNSEHVEFHIPPELNGKIVILNKELTDEEYNALLEECGLAICTSACEGFGHAVNEAMSSGCNLILSPIKPFHELTKEALWLESLQTIEHPECYGSIVDVTVQSVISMLTKYTKTSFKHKKQVSNNVRLEYEKRHSEFIELIKPMLEFPIADYSLDSMLPKESELPDISIVTLTRDRREFMPLAQYSYMIQSYPEDKLEWVIVDDGDDSIEDTLMGISNVKYIRCNSKMTIGQKRNLGVQNAMYDILAMVDDDDVYPNNSVLHRAAMMLMKPEKECVFCTTIPCYDITKYSSFINVPPNTLPMSQRVSEATLMFTRKFWQDRNFPDIQVAEGDAFIHGREHMCREISPQEVIVSLIHPKNTSSRKIPDIPEPNGCHYGFNEKLFAVVSEIGETLKVHATEEGLAALGGAATTTATA